MATNKVSYPLPFGSDGRPRTHSFADEDERDELEAANFRKALVETGAADELVRVLIHHYDGSTGMPSLVPEDLAKALQTEMSAYGKFPIGLPDLVKGPKPAEAAKALQDENEALKSQVSQLSETLSPKLEEVQALGMCELITLHLSELHAVHVPDMEPGASSSDPFLRVSVAGPQPHLEWRTQTSASANVEHRVRWEGEQLTLTVPAPQWSPEACLDRVLAGTAATLKVRVTLWDDDLTNPDDYMGTATFDLPANVGLKGADGAVEDAEMELTRSARVIAAPAPADAIESGELGEFDQPSPAQPCLVSFKWRIRQAGFDVPQEPETRVDIYQ